MLRRFLNTRKNNSPPPAPRVPADVRLYAVGDIHGCDAQLAALLRQIDDDHGARSPKRQVLVLLGDLIDRGPDSAAVVERVRRLVADRPDVRVLAGNHEELLLMACAGDDKALRIFARNGGRETALSYGIDPATYDFADFAALRDLLEMSVPLLHREFLSGLEDRIVVGDYAFVHAGIRPGVALEDQDPNDLRWIRNRFLDYTEAHEKFIVHGHTITAEVDEQPNRLGIDTGAYLSGRLTAVALEGDRRWFLQT